MPELNTNAGYNYEVFVSYRKWKIEKWDGWMQMFVTMLTTYLAPCIGSGAVYVDYERAEGGVDWPEHLAASLARSKVMLAVLSKDYFRSDWCKLELELMLRRQELMKGAGGQGDAIRLVIPVVIHDGDSFPEEVRRIQQIKFHDHADPNMRRPSKEYRDFCAQVRNVVCPAIEEALTGAPHFDPAWVEMARVKFDSRFRCGDGSQSINTSI
ncbi:MAG: toll/interleukin-1 receptor domain-containing protein [Bacteroidetes bacterium]|nr:toll/interleukin-1 receptor domain-containing protein [Bacteroidota bacterium]